MVKARDGRLLVERPIGGGTVAAATGASARGVALPARSVTVNLAESPLGWLFFRGFVSRAQYDAGERLRGDYERAALAPSVTMTWDSAPMGSRRGGQAPASSPSGAQIDARRRFDDALAFAGPGFCDILWRVVCAGERMREAETALGWPARGGKLVLGLALDRLALYYRIG